MLNNVIIMGRLTAAPELRSTQSGTSVLQFTVAVDRDYLHKYGQLKVMTEQGWNVEKFIEVFGKNYL